MAQLKTPMDESEVDVRKVQTVPLRRTGTEESTVIVSVTEAIRAAGLEDGGSFRFMPGAVEELGMLPALGEEHEVDGRSEDLTRNIYREGAGESTFRLIIPPSALREIVDPENIDWKNPPEVDVWVGDRMLAFELAEPEERTVHIDRGTENDDADNGGSR